MTRRAQEAAAECEEAADGENEPSNASGSR